jgi:hypothetical protein
MVVERVVMRDRELHSRSSGGRQRARSLRNGSGCAPKGARGPARCLMTTCLRGTWRERDLPVLAHGRDRAPNVARCPRTWPQTPLRPLDTTEPRACARGPWCRGARSVSRRRPPAGRPWSASALGRGAARRALRHLPRQSASSRPARGIGVSSRDRLLRRLGHLPRLGVAGEARGVGVPVGLAHPAEAVLVARLLGEVLDRRIVRLDREPLRADAPAQGHCQLRHVRRSSSRRRPFGVGPEIHHSARAPMQGRGWRW